MTSAWKEPSGWDDRSENHDVESDEGQLDLFEILPLEDDRTMPPLAAAGEEDAEFRRLDPYASGNDPAHVAPDDLDRGDARPVNVAFGRPAPATAFFQAGVSEDDDLRRLEESIRWLVDAGGTPALQERHQASRGLARVDRDDDDGLLLDPEMLFRPRQRSRLSTFAAGAAKLLLVTAVAAPSAYLIANWLQFPGPATSSGWPAVTVAAIPVTQGQGDRIAALPAFSALPASAPAQEAARSEDNASAPPLPERVAAAGRGAEEPVVTAQQAAPEAPAVTPAAPVSPPVPAKPSLSQDEIALMLEKGHAFFERGDLAAARLFFRRAAAAGDSEAAIAMGETYDPDVLAQRFIRGIEGDAREAQRWYAKARSPVRERIEMLAQRP